MALGRTTAVLRHIDRLMAEQKSRRLSDRDLLRRFTRQGDEAAFAEILRRHGTMVLHVCGRLLAEPQDAEDAFQATFLVLLRRASGLRWRDCVAGWLHEVAYRVARNMRKTRLQRHVHEARAATRLSQESNDDISLREAQAILHEELHRLPDRLRAPLVLCYLEGATQDEAAVRLGWSLRTLKRRLRHGRALLHARLTRRGLTLPAVLSTSLLTGGTASAMLTRATLAAAVSFLTGRAALSPAVSAIAVGVLRGMFLTKLRMTALVVLVTLLGAGYALRDGSGQTNPLPAKEQDPAESSRKENPVQAGVAAAAGGQLTDHYGDALPQGAVSRMGTIRLRHRSSVEGVAFSPNGKMLASAGWDEAVRLWDPRTGKPIRTLVNPRGEGSFAVAFSPDGTRLASVGVSGGVRLWEVATGKILFEKKGHAERVYGVAFAPDGRRFASAGGNVCVWDTANGAEVFNLKSGGVRDSQGVAFSPDGESLAASFGREIQVWSSKDGSSKLVIPKAHGDDVVSVAFRDNDTLISSGYKYVQTKTAQGKPLFRRVGQVRIWHATNGKLLRELAAPDDDDGAGCSLALSVDGKLVAAAFQRKIRIWDAGSGRLVRVLADYRNPYSGRTHTLAFSPDAKLLAAGAGDITVRLWDLSTGKRLLDFSEGHQDRVDAIGYSPDGRDIITGGHDGTLRLWDAGSAKLIRVYPFGSGFLAGVTTTAVSPDGKTLAAGGYDYVDANLTGFWKSWDLASGKKLREQKLHARAQALAFAPDGATLAVATGTDRIDRLRSKTAGRESAGDSIGLWDVATGTERATIPGHAGFRGWLAFSADGQTLASLGEDGKVSVRKLASRQQTAQFAMPGRGTNSAAFSMDGKIVVGNAPFSDTLSIWDLAAGQELRRIHVPRSHGSIVALSPDGRILASAGAGLFNAPEPMDTGIHLWEMATAAEILSFQPDTTTVSLAFSPKGRTLVSGMHNGTALTWNVRPALRIRSLLPKDLERLWSDLAGERAASAYLAVCTLAAVPETSVPYLRTHLPPATEINKTRADELIVKLGSDNFAVRQRAYSDLEKLGERAAPFLKQALASDPPLEVRRRLESLLTLARQVRSPETLRRTRAVQVLEDIGTNEARQILSSVAAGFSAARETQDARASLGRLAKRRRDNP